MEFLSGPSLLIILVFVHFHGINSMEKGGSSSGSSQGLEKVRQRRPGAGRPRGSLSRRRDGIVKGHFRMKECSRIKPVRLTRAPDDHVRHMGQLIDVWIDKNLRIVQADYQNNNCPTTTEYGTAEYLVRLVDLGGNKKIVECVHRDGTLLGVRAAKPTTGNYMEPSSTQWFIVYFDKVFRVRKHPMKNEVKITLAANDEDEVLQPPFRRGEIVDMAGFKFRVIRSLPYHHVIGAEPVLPAAQPALIHNVHHLIP